MDPVAAICNPTDSHPRSNWQKSICQPELPKALENSSTESKVQLIVWKSGKKDPRIFIEISDAATDENMLSRILDNIYYAEGII